MRIGIGLPNHWGVDDVGELVQLAELVEGLGFDSLWVAEHLLSVGFVKDRLGTKPYYDPLALLAYVAARTSRIRLGTSVLVLPYHPPVSLAKFAATLDQLSSGRLTLGVGAGSLREEFDALNIPFSERGGRTNEAIEILRQLWSGTDVSYDGRYWNLNDVTLTPAPRQDQIPVWIGGSSAAAIKRAARLGDGWHPSNSGADLMTPSVYARGRSTILSMAADTQPHRGPLTWSLQLGIGMDGSASNQPQLPPDVAAIADACAAYEAVGVEHIVITPRTAEVQEIQTLVQGLADEMSPWIS